MNKGAIGLAGAGTIYRNGEESLHMNIPGGTQAVRLIHFAFSIDEIPTFDRMSGYICHFMDTNSLIRASLHVTPSGRLQLVDGAPLSANQTGSGGARPNVLLTSSAPVIEARTWYYISIQITTNGADPLAAVTVYLGEIVLGNKVLEGTGLAFTDTDANPALNNNIDVLGFLPASWGSSIGTKNPTTCALRDIVICDTSGTQNNSLLGQAFVSAQEMRMEDVGSGWEVNHRQRIGDGVLDLNTHSTGLRAADAAALEIGASDFTFESGVRFHSLPGAAEVRNIIAKWRDDDNNRSWRLAYYGSDSTLRWEVSTDGITVTTVKSLPWTPILDRWHEVAVVRSAGQTLLFIDGFQLGVPVADANTYFDSVAPLGVGARFNATSTLVTAEVFKGWMDETRLTIGVARYTADYTPATTKFGRNATDDPSFASVVLLLGYDGLSTADESSFGRTMSTTSPAAAAILPDDGTYAYQVLNNRPPEDDSYIEAAQLYAEGTFTFDAVPTNTETLTIGAKTYTWKTVLAAANDILIGADIASCIVNAIAAINHGTGEGTLYGTGTVASVDAIASVFVTPQFLLRALSVGVAGNTVATTDTMVNGFFRATTLTGGQDIPTDSTFALERLPIDVTGVLGVQMTTRHYKTDAGAATIRIDLVGPAGAVAAGTPVGPDLNPAWARQVFETDPDTSGNLTPSTLISGKIRFKRTA